MREKKNFDQDENDSEKKERDDFPASQPGHVMARRYGRAAGIERIVTGDRVEHQRIVVHRSRQGSDMVERE